MEPGAYRMKTTFMMDFKIAEAFGHGAVKDTYRRAFDEWKDDVVYFTELSLVMNWRCWHWFEKDAELSKMYADWYYETRDHVYSNWDENDVRYYFEVTD